jgi:hypothetical protein
MDVYGIRFIRRIAIFLMVFSLFAVAGELTKEAAAGGQVKSRIGSIVVFHASPVTNTSVGQPRFAE